MSNVRVQIPVASMRRLRSAHRPKHKVACAAIKKSWETLEREEAALYAHPGDFMMPADVLNTGVGRFWGIAGTRDYMRARFAAADALLRIDTAAAVEKALGHFTAMLQLNRSDNLGVRDIIPCLLLRLGREQKCYDFLKWWGLVDNDYAWHDVTTPYLDIRNADAFEPVDILRSGDFMLSLSQLVALTLLKLRMYLDLAAFETDFPFERIDPDAELLRPVGKLVRAKLRTLNQADLSRMVQALKGQYRRLCSIVHDANPHFWRLLVDETLKTPAPPASYEKGSIEEAHLALYQCKSAWEESEDAIIMIDADTAAFASVYEGPAAVVAATDGLPRGLGTAEDLPKRRGTGQVFPSIFTPPPTSHPAETFPPTPVGRCQTDRFVYRNDHQKVLVYTDGACANNGQPNPRAGWAVVYGPPNRGGGSNYYIVSGRLEDKGPFGDDSMATSNRAELRAVIAALRLCDWRGEGFDSIVIATDSSYVVDGATGWAKGWMRNGWKTRTGSDVKNRDLWELLLGEVESWMEHGLRVELWKVPREVNGDADGAAKEASNKGYPSTEFRDIVITSSQGTTAATQQSPRVLALCLEHEALFVDVFGKLVSQITSKAKMERAATLEAAFAMLSQEPPPTVILVADGALTRQRKVLITSGIFGNRETGAAISLLPIVIF
ncbi:hypothetical protein CONLIGDRAFT_693786 [Coniochaeta ligniaria NRRL 30616]|uniref:ribonuclease H n=1 Tax=Coniochaeta ligniaria NRRL 30616 TaxID=1408157 RepID=A0A1J7I779_9PEZI|nr:hypothetical protein CONLIGDRAFT_693786 [Coniochaeta ligniaria NRRL 30616]